MLGNSDPKHWDELCLVRRGCALVASIAPCGSDAPAPTWSEIQPFASTKMGQVVRVSGALAAEGVMRTQIRCMPGNGEVRRRCCNEAHAAIVVVGTWEPLWLAGLACDGDDSTICCNAPAFGETIVAQGVLRPATPKDDELAFGRWVLSDVTLCRPVNDHSP